MQFIDMRTISWCCTNHRSALGTLHLSLPRGCWNWSPKSIFVVEVKLAFSNVIILPTSEKHLMIPSGTFEGCHAMISWWILQELDINETFEYSKSGSHAKANHKGRKRPTFSAWPTWFEIWWSIGFVVWVRDAFTFEEKGIFSLDIWPIWIRRSKIYCLTAWTREPIIF